MPAWRTPEEVAAADLRQMLPAVQNGDQRTIVLVAERSGTPLGCVFVATEDDFFTRRPGAHVEVVAVARDAEGQGLARVLLDAAETWARERGYDHMTLNVFVANQHARAVYEHLGYQAEIVRYRKSL
jgi:GNAT superfamily N-acetyltransferase